MIWPTGILYPVRSRYFLPRRPSSRPVGFTRRTSVVVILFLVCIILYLSRYLGENARNSPAHRRLLLRNQERESWKATHDAYIQLARQAQVARGRKAWLLRKRIADLGKGIWTKSIEDESNKGCPIIPAPAIGPAPTPVKLFHGDELESAELYGYLETGLPLGNHGYNPNGLLEVNPAGPHPVYELVKRSEEEWVGKHRRASKTLQEAVKEYKRRYGRLPPSGFDVWWDYVQENHVSLPDEYDQIHEDLTRYWAVDPQDLQATQRAHEAHSDTFTIGKDTWTSPFSVLNFSFNGDGGSMLDHLDAQDPRPRSISKRSDLPDSFFSGPHAHTHDQHLNGAFNILEMLADVQAHIPPFRAVFSPHDNPSMLRDWDKREMALNAAKIGKTIDIKEIENGPANVLGWRAACPPDSPARRQVDSIDWDAPDVFSELPLPIPPNEIMNKTFIYSHNTSTDPCMHPSHFITHGQFISHRKGPVPERRGGGFIPMFSYSPTRVHDDIVVATGEGSQYSSPSFSRRDMEDTDVALDLGTGDNSDEDDFGMDFDIEELLKLPLDELEHALDLDTDSRLLWRGSNTGMWHAPRRGWERSQRSRLVFWAGGGEGVVARGVGADAERDVENDLGQHVDVKTARALGAGLGGTVGVLIPPPSVRSADITPPPALSVDPSDLPFGNITRLAVGPPTQVMKSLWAPSMLDIAFTAAGSDDGGIGPLNCEGVTCEKLRKVFEWRRRMEMKEASQYRFVMDVDGNAWSSRFRKLLAGPSSSSTSTVPSMSSSSATEEESLKKTVRQKRWDQHLSRRRLDDSPASLVFKSTIYKEWWADRSQAWVHYVPVQVGLDDLWDVLVFFRGKLGEEVDVLIMELRRYKLEEEKRRIEEATGSKSAEETKRVDEIYKRKTRALEMRLRDALERHLMGRKIARRGREWAARYWRKEDMVAYMFRLFLEYARVMSPDRDQMFFDPDDPDGGVKEPSRRKMRLAAQQPVDLQTRDEVVIVGDEEPLRPSVKHADEEIKEVLVGEVLDELDADYHTTLVDEDEDEE